MQTSFETYRIKKDGGARGAAKFREETSKKADISVKDRVAARQILANRSFVCKRYFAPQQKKSFPFHAPGKVLFILRRYNRLMPRSLLIILLLACAHLPAHAQNLSAIAGYPTSRLCRPAIEAAERRHGIPSRLLAAIARVESGRTDPATGEVGPWPWTINVEGQGFYFDTKAQAIAAVNAWRARGSRSIDVGCTQVNLVHHPDAFPNLEMAFDPATNADYAARFLTKLRGQTGNWEKATAWYHSATPELGEAYQRRVAGVWPDEQKQPAAAFGPGTALASAWNATLGREGHPILGRGGNPRVIMLNQIAAQPSGQASAGSTQSSVGRGLDAYRAMPVTWAFRSPPPPPSLVRAANGTGPRPLLGSIPRPTGATPSSPPPATDRPTGPATRRVPAS